MNTNTTKEDEMTTTVELKKPELKALLAFASKDETRPNLNGIGFVRMNDGKVYLCATDGHVLVLRWCKDMHLTAGQMGKTMAREHLDRSLKLLGKNDVVTLDAVALTASIPGVGDVDIDGHATFPAAAQVVGEHNETEGGRFMFSFNVSFVKKLDEVKKATAVLSVNGYRHDPVFKLGTGPLDPISFAFPSTPWAGVIMPMRAPDKVTEKILHPGLGDGAEPEPEPEEEEKDEPPDLSVADFGHIGIRLKDMELVEEVNKTCADKSESEWLLTYWTYAEDGDVEAAIDEAHKAEEIKAGVVDQWLDYLEECSV